MIPLTVTDDDDDEDDDDKSACAKNNDFISDIKTTAPTAVARVQGNNYNLWCLASAAQKWY